jgi:hypothetical protein
MNSVVRINGVIYPMSDGSVYRDFYNETLDNGTVVLVQTTQLTIEPFDTLEISFDAGATYKKFYILDITESVASFTPALYNYTITYVSRTIHLQKIILPNISNTKRKIGTAKSAFTKILEINNLYGLRKRSGGGHSLVYTTSTRLNNLTTNVECIEFTLQTPTMFQVLNTILSPLNCIITINQNDQLDYIDLTQKNTSLNAASFNEVITTKNGAEYVSDLMSDIVNGITNKETITEWLTVRRFDQALLPRDGELAIYTAFPIHRIIKVELELLLIKGSLADTDQDMSIGLIDITDLVIEKEKWDLYEPADGISIQYDENNKQNFAWYQRGSNSINGMFAKEAFWTHRTMQYILQSKLNPANDEPFWGWFYDLDDIDIDLAVDMRAMKFKVTYIPVLSAKVLTSSYLQTKHNVVMPNSQTENFVDIQKFGLANEQTANRVGNPELTVINRYNNATSVPALGDYIGDYVLASREISVHQGFTNFKGSFFENFVQKTMFTGIVAKRRMWAIAKVEDAIERSELIKINAEFSFINKGEVSWSPFSVTASRNAYVQYLMSGLIWSSSSNKYTTSSSKRVIGTIGSTLLEVDPVLGDIYSDEYFLESAIMQAGRSAVIVLKMFDNFAVGFQVSSANASGPLQKYVSYVDGNGEAISIKLKLLKNIRNAITDYGLPNFTGTENITAYDQVNGNTTYTITMRNYTDAEVEYKAHVRDTAWKLPATYNGQYQSGDVIFEYTMPINKDNRELLRISIQNEFTSDSKNIVVTEKMAEYCGLLTGTQNANIRFYYSTTEQYGLQDKNAKGTIINLAPISITNNQIFLTSGVLAAIPSYSAVTSWGIADLDGKLIIGVNKPTVGVAATSIFLNILKYRQGL